MTLVKFDIDGIINGYLGNSRKEGLSNSIPTKVLVAINLMVSELNRLRCVEERRQQVEEENLLLRERIIEEQQQRNQLELIIESTHKRQTLSMSSHLDDFGSHVTLN